MLEVLYGNVELETLAQREEEQPGRCLPMQSQLMQLEGLELETAKVVDMLEATVEVDMVADISMEEVKKTKVDVEIATLSLSYHHPNFWSASLLFASLEFPSDHLVFQLQSYAQQQVENVDKVNYLVHQFHTNVIPMIPVDYQW